MKRLTQVIWMTVAIAVVLSISFLVTRTGRETGDTFLRSFAENLDTFEDESPCGLAEVTPWEWDTVYFVPPRTTQKQVETMIGFATDVALADKSKNGEGRIVFVWDDKVVEVMPFYSSECTYIVDADSFFRTAGSGEYLRFQVLDDIPFTKTSRNIGGNNWAILVLNDADLSDYIFS